MSTTENKNSWKEIFAERLQRAIDEKRSNAEATAKDMKKAHYKISAKMLRDYLDKVSMPSAERLLWFADFFGKPMEWFFGRDRETFRIPNLAIDITPTLRSFSADHPLSTQHYVPIRLLKDQIAAGDPTSIQPENLDGWVLIYRSDEWMPHDPENYTCAHVRGYSMSPILEPGDIVAIDHADRDVRELHNKMVVFRENAMDDNFVTVKWLRYHRDTDVIFAESENRQERDTGFSISGNEAYERIVGRVAWWWAKR